MIVSSGDSECDEKGLILTYTEKKVIRGPFSNSFFVSKPCSKLHDFLPKDVSFK